MDEQRSDVVFHDLLPPTKPLHIHPTSAAVLVVGVIKGFMESTNST